MISYSDERKYSSCEAAHKAAGPHAAALVDNRVPVQRKPNTTGLPDNLKSGIENLSGHSMDDVKVHYNSSQPAQLNAHAYAQGNQIHLASGQEKHLAHEAWHVVQQKQGRVKPTTQLKGKADINDDKSFEKKTGVTGMDALQLMHSQTDHQEPVPGNNVNLPVVQRVQWGTIGTGLGVIAGGLGAGLLTGGMAPLAMGLTYGLGALAGGYAGRKIGQAADYSSLKSMNGLQAFESQHGGSSQGTLAFIHASDGNYYMIEQETNNRVKAAAEAIGIIYVKQGRHSGYHAEVRSIDWMTENGFSLNGAVIWVSKPICADCARELQQRSVTIKTAISADAYHNWVPPTGQSRAPVGAGVVYRGRRSEVERLAD